MAHSKHNVRRAMDANSRLLFLSDLMEQTPSAATGRLLAQVIDDLTIVFSTQVRTARFISRLLFDLNYWEHTKAYLSDAQQISWVLIGYRVHPHTDGIDTKVQLWRGVSPDPSKPYRGLVEQCFGVHYALLLQSIETNTPQLVRQLMQDNPPFIWNQQQSGGLLPRDYNL